MHVGGGGGPPFSSGKLLALLIIPYDMEPCPGSLSDNKRGKYGINIGQLETDSGQGPRERGRRDRDSQPERGEIVRQLEKDSGQSLRERGRRDRDSQPEREER